MDSAQAAGVRVAPYWPENQDDRHNGGSNVLFEDGHAGWVKDVAGRFAPGDIYNSEQGAFWVGYPNSGSTPWW